MTQEAEQAVKRAQEACERIQPEEPWDPIWNNERKSPKATRSTNEELRRRLTIARNIEASLRRELADAKANEARWCNRIKALEERLSHVIAVASGEAP